MKSINSLYSVKFSRNMTSKYTACKLKLYGHISVCVSNARFFSALTWNKSYSECRLLGCKRWVSFLPLSFSINFNYYNWSYVYDVCMPFVGCVFSNKYILGFNWIGCDSMGWSSRFDVIKTDSIEWHAIVGYEKETHRFVAESIQLVWFFHWLGDSKRNGAWYHWLYDKSLCLPLIWEIKSMSSIHHTQ